MHKQLETIKKNEGSPKVIKNLFSKAEIDKLKSFTKNFR